MRSIFWSLLLAASFALAQPAAGQEVLPTPRPSGPTGYTLDDLIQISLSRNPALAQTQAEIEAAQGKADQAGRYPNPVMTVGGEEVGARGGIYTLPSVSQEIVTNNKLGLSRAVAEREVDQAYLNSLSKRYALMTAIRQGYFEVLTLQRRNEFLDRRLGDWNKQYKKLEDENVKKVLGKVGYLPFRIESNRLTVEAETAAREYAGAWARVAAAAGVPRLAFAPFKDFDKDHLPAYPFLPTTKKDATKDFLELIEPWRAAIVENHPDARYAQVGLAKAEAASEREQAYRKPNVTLAAGYQRNFNDREDQALFQVGMPLPLFNRNQGNIRAAHAELARASLEVDRLRNDLFARLATAFGQYSSARQRAELLAKYVTDSEDLAKATLADWQAPKSELSALNVAQAQRAAIDARLEYIRAWGEAWRAASEIAGLLLEDNWPMMTPKKNP